MRTHSQVKEYRDTAFLIPKKYQTRYFICTNRLEAEGKGTKASEGKCGHVKRGVVGRVQSCLGTPSTLCLSSTFKR